MRKKVIVIDRCQGCYNYKQQIVEYHNRLAYSHYCKKYKKEINIQLKGGVRRPSMSRTDQVEVLWNKIKVIASRLDINLKEEHRWSSADICFADESKYLIDGLGPVGAKLQKKSEFKLRHSLLERSALLAVILSELNVDK